MLSDKEIEEGIRLGERAHRKYHFEIMVYGGTGSAVYCIPEYEREVPDEKVFLEHAANHYTEALYDLQNARQELRRLREVVDEIRWKISQ